MEMKKTFFSLLSVAVLAMAGITEAVAQESGTESTVEQRRIGQWVITREYSQDRSTEDGVYERSNVSYDVSFGHGFEAHIPFYYMGFSGFMADGPFSMNFSDVRLDEARSWEWGIYLPLDAVRLAGDHVGLGFAFGFGRSMYKFDTPNYFFTSRSQGGRTTFFSTQSDVEPYDETWFRYWSFKLPVQLEFQTSDDGFFLAVGPELEYRFSPASRGRYNGKRKETITSNISMHPLNVNLLAQVGYGNVSLMAKTSLVELFSGSLDHSAYSSAVWPVSLCLGLTF